MKSLHHQTNFCKCAKGQNLDICSPTNEGYVLLKVLPHLMRKAVGLWQCPHAGLHLLPGGMRAGA